MADKSDYEKAKDKVKELKDFYEHLLIYLFVNIFLFIINVFVNLVSGSPAPFSPSEMWFYWISVFWGIALIIHGLSTFWEVYVTDRFLSKEWEEKKIQDYMKKK